MIRNLLQSGTVQIEEIKTIKPAADSGPSIAPESAAGADSYKTGSLWIDPATHRIMQLGPGRKIMKSNAIYAVGVMTRGQIINASMVRGIVEATSRIADDLISCLT